MFISQHEAEYNQMRYEEQARYDDNSERYAATRADLEIEASCAYGYDDHDDACASLNAGHDCDCTQLEETLKLRRTEYVALRARFAEAVEEIGDDGINWGASWRLMVVAASDYDTARDNSPLAIAHRVLEQGGALLKTLKDRLI